MEVIRGIPVSPGIVIGRAFALGEADEHVPLRRVPPADIPRQLERLAAAWERSSAELESLRERTARELGEEPAKIFEFHIGLLKDRSLFEPIRAEIEREGVIAEYAVSSRFKALAAQFKAMGNEVFRQKANDVIDLDRRVLGHLIGLTANRLATLDRQVILIGHELTPSQAAALDPAKVVGFATDAGGRTSHTSIIARALDIPAVVGCQTLTHVCEDGDEIIVDGDIGQVLVQPDAETIERYRRLVQRDRTLRQGLREIAPLAPETLDGVRISLLGNIEFPREIETVLANGGDGVGLYRTEYLFLASEREPTEEEHFEAYREAVGRLGGRTLTIRTIDLGADKYTQLRAEEPERNPFLGLRSIRYCLQNLGLFRTQLRALLRASALGPIKVMFPLVSTMTELRQTRLILNDVMEELDEEGVPFDRKLPVGIMIEVPSAALMARVFAREVAFFSLGTNDLIQYTLAVDRGNERVAGLYTGASPAVLQLMKIVVRAARQARIDLSICGEMAGEALYTMLLIGMGLRTLSLVPSQIPQIKRVIRAVDVPQCERLARRVGSFDSERQVLSTLRDELRKIVPESSGGLGAD
ncbi:MAG TPA: phosphoenolpyruvate--protein phosphotransferase [Phycisphaerales bacterium]|nr:phosphoenolpyruvate--protein phosphotransferase [Phycisphaerales bacterium]HMP38003.1 phosphoenolpyruvate--protein phosphotransferase [Phycisphaerales bacterium]